MMLACLNKDGVKVCNEGTYVSKAETAKLTSAIAKWIPMDSWLIAGYYCHSLDDIFETTDSTNFWNQ